MKKPRFSRSRLQFSIEPALDSYRGEIIARVSSMLAARYRALGENAAGSFSVPICRDGATECVVYGRYGNNRVEVYQGGLETGGGGGGGDGIAASWGLPVSSPSTYGGLVFNNGYDGTTGLDATVPLAGLTQSIGGRNHFVFWIIEDVNPATERYVYWTWSIQRNPAFGTGPNPQTGTTGSFRVFYNRHCFCIVQGEANDGGSNFDTYCPPCDITVTAKILEATFVQDPDSDIQAVFDDGWSPASVTSGTGTEVRTIVGTCEVRGGA